MNQFFVDLVTIDFIEELMSNTTWWYVFPVSIGNKLGLHIGLTNLTLLVLVSLFSATSALLTSSGANHCPSQSALVMYL